MARKRGKRVMNNKKKIVAKNQSNSETEIETTDYSMILNQSKVGPNIDLNNDSSNDSFHSIINSNNETNDNKIKSNEKSNNVRKVIENETEFISKLIEDNKYFESLIDLIPPKIYFEGNEEIMESIEANKKSKFGEDSELTSKAKHKRCKLDPNNDQKVSEIAHKFYSNGKQNGTKKLDKMEELRQKLNKRIDSLKSNRGGKSVGKRESKKQRRQENQLRSSKQKGFIKTKANNTDLNNNTSETNDKKRKRTNSETNDVSETLKNDKLPKIYNSEGNLVFSKFDFVSSVSKTDTRHEKHKKKTKKLDKLLTKVKKDEEKMSRLETTDTNAAKQMKEKKLWRNALEKSEGNKVRDNSKLIEKTIKKKKQLKAKSAKKWSERTESVEHQKKRREDKRKRNIKERKDNNKQIKLKKAQKKGRIIPNKNK